MHCFYYFEFSPCISCINATVESLHQQNCDKLYIIMSGNYLLLAHINIAQSATCENYGLGRSRS